MTETSAARNVMLQIYGEDVYHGFADLLAADMQGWNSEHPAFAACIASDRPRVLLDVGVWKGRSSIFLANLLRQHGIPGAVIAIDTFLGSPEHWNRNRSDRIFEHLRMRHGYPHLYYQFLSNVIRSGCGDYIVPLPQTSENAAKILANLGIMADFIHIDAAHDFESVLRDALLYWTRLNPGGVLIGDDYHPTWPGVVRGAEQFAQEVGLQLEIQDPKWIVRKPRAAPA